MLSFFYLSLCLFWEYFTSISVLVVLYIYFLFLSLVCERTSASFLFLFFFCFFVFVWSPYLFVAISTALSMNRDCYNVEQRPFQLKFKCLLNHNFLPGVGACTCNDEYKITVNPSALLKVSSAKAPGFVS